MKTSTQTLILANEFGPEEAVRMICDAGFDCIDHSLFSGKRGKMDIEKTDFLSDMEKLREIAVSYEVDFNQTHAPFASFREGDDDYNEWVKPLIIKAIEATGILGAKYVVIHPFAISKNQKQANMDFFGSLIPYAEKHDVKIAIENMFGHDPVKDVLVKNVCSDGPELCDYIDTLNSKSIVACIDIGHCGLVGEDAAHMIKMVGGDRIKCLHVHDNDHKNDLHTIPFTEKIDFPSVIQALIDINYNGELTLEADHFLYGFPKELYKDCLSLMSRTARYLADMSSVDE